MYPVVPGLFFEGFGFLIPFDIRNYFPKLGMYPVFWYSKYLISLNNLFKFIRSGDHGNIHFLDWPVFP
jgi:hypothetical protein